jgi:Predicted transcriptional regulators
MVAGHRRKYASERNNLRTLPCIVRDMTDDEAVIIMVDTNLKQRQHILPSEKAWAYKLKLYSVKELSKDVDDSARQIHRYIRLTNLIDPILDMVDENKIALRPANA